MRSRATWRGTHPALVWWETAATRLKTFIQDVAGATPPAQWAASFGAEGAERKLDNDDCGFIERLVLAGTDFQIGVISTESDVEEGVRTNGDFYCPSGLPFGRNPLPARGCLVPSGTEPAVRMITSRDGSVETIANRLRNTILNVGTCGSAYEQGLLAMEEFLSPDTVRASPTCNADLERFLRKAECLRAEGSTTCLKDAAGQDIMGQAPKLVVIVLSDEEDCSHGGALNGNVSGFGECYTRPEALLPAGRFVEFLKGLKSNADLLGMASIVGGFRDGQVFTPGNCRCNGSSAGAAPLTADTCTPMQGAVDADRCGVARANDFCGLLPDITTATDDLGPGPHLECCTADRGSRYVAVSSEMAHHFEDSICAQNYRETMLEVARMVNTQDSVPLGEPVADPRQLQVEVKGANGQWQVKSPFTARTDERFRACLECTEVACSGWGLVEGCKVVKFYGDDVPQPGAEVRVAFLGAALLSGAECNGGGR